MSHVSFSAAAQDHDHRLRIGVLMGGVSIEHEVSFNSGRTVCDHLDHKRFRAVPIFQTITGDLYILPQRFVHRGKTTDFLHRLEQEAQHITWDELPTIIDFAFITLHGRAAEDGSLQGMLELLGIPYLGSTILASALSMDKALQRTWLGHAGITVPKGCTIRMHDLHTLSEDAQQTHIMHRIEQDAHFTFPLIVKPVHEGSSLGVTIAHTFEELMPAVHTAAQVTPGIIQDVIIEEYVTGMEFTCIVVADRTSGELRALPPTEIVPERELFTYEEKYMPGRGTKYTPARCTDEIITRIQETAIATMKALGMRTYGRIDGIVRADGTVVIIDPNSLGGMAPSSFAFLQAAQIGMSHTDFINHLLDSALTAARVALPQSQDISMTTTTKRMRVAVLLGGPSAEREVSLDSGRNVVYKLSPYHYDVTPVFVTRGMHAYRINNALLVKNSTHEIHELLTEDMRINWHDMPRLFDFVFIALHGGPGENGTVQGALETLGVPYNGSGIAASALCMDKAKTCAFLAREQFAVPRGTLISLNSIDQATVTSLLNAAQISFPVISKPHDDGCSTLVRKSATVDELIDALSEMHAHGRPVALVEEFIRGMELTVGVIGNHAIHVLPPSHTVTNKGVLSIEEKFLPGAGENQTPAPLPASAIAFVQAEIGRAYQTLGCRGYARIDCFYQTPDISPTGKERLIILEVNTLPALTPATCLFHQAAEVGIAPMELLDRIITYGVEAYQATHNKHTEVRKLL